MNRLVLLRGLPGSGKSFEAARRLAAGLVDAVYETDDFFLHNGVYHFDASALAEAHAWNIARTEAYLRTQHNKILCVANTFVKRFEMQPYITIARRHRAAIEVLRCNGSYENVHGVPETIVAKRRKAWESLRPEWGLVERSIEPV